MLALRARQQRNFLATLLLSQGVPMLAHGDEFGRTQRGNNNAYCQDNELSWVRLGPRQTLADASCSTSPARMVAAAPRPPGVPPPPVLPRRGRPRAARATIGDIAWFTPGGEQMTERDWQRRHARAVTVFLNGDAISEPDQRGERIVDDSFLLMFNAHHEELEFTVPPAEAYGTVVDRARSTPRTTTAGPPSSGDTFGPGEVVVVVARSVVLLRRPRETVELPLTAATRGVHRRRSGCREPPARPGR